MLTQQQIEAIILYHLYCESEAAAKRFREAVSEAAKEIAAQQSVQLTGGSLRDLQAESTPQHLSGLKADTNPPASS